MDDQPIRARFQVATPEAIRALQAFAESPRPIEPAALQAQLRLVSHVLAGIAESVDCLVQMLPQTTAKPIEVSGILPIDAPWTKRSGHDSDA